MKHKGLLMAGLIVVAGAAASTVAIAASDDRSASAPTRLPVQGEAAIQAVDQPAASQFAFLTAPRTGEDTLPSKAAEMVKPQIPYGANVALSKRVAWQGETAVYAVPGRGVICVVMPESAFVATGCQSTDALAQGTTGAGPTLVHGPTTDRIFAIVPDGVKSVTVSLQSGKRVDVPAQDGGYYTEVSADDPAVIVTYDGPNGTVAQEVPAAPHVPFSDKG